MLGNEHRQFPPSGAESRKADTHKITNTINEIKHKAGNDTQLREHTAGVGQGHKVHSGQEEKPATLTPQMNLSDG